MDIVRSCAKYLNKSLIDLANQGASRGFRVTEDDIFNAKACIFNACTVALIASVVFGLGGSRGSALVLGACSYFGRKVAEESFHAASPSRFLSDLVERCAPGTIKPKPWLEFGEVVVFYDIKPRASSR